MPPASASKSARYVGPSPRMSVDLPDGTRVYVDRGESVEFPAEVAEGLLEQEGVWEGAGSQRSSSGPTVADLRKQAKDLGLNGYSKLGKDALAARIAAHKAEGAKADAAEQASPSSPESDGGNDDSNNGPAKGEEE